jgi:hypothetical protein
MRPASANRSLSSTGPTVLSAEIALLIDAEFLQVSGFSSYSHLLFRVINYG